MIISLTLAVLLNQAAAFQPIVTKMSGCYIAAEVHTKDGKSHMLLLDSGSNESYVSDSIVSDEERKHGEAVIRLDVGPTQMFAVAQPVPDAKIEASIEGLPTEGVLGINLLKQMQLEIDYDAQIVSARYGGALSWAGKDYSPILMERDPDNLYTVAGQVGEVFVRLCVDTGASAMVLDSGRVKLEGFQKLSSAKLRTFSGAPESSRFLLDSVKLGDQSFPWMVAYSQIWNSSDDGTIGTDQFGSPRIILDFPGSCLYLAKSNPVSEAAQRVLGLPVQIDGNALRFRDNLPERFRSSSGAKIVAIRSMSADTIVAALEGKGPEAAKTLASVFSQIRELGLVTTERDGQRTLVPIQVQD